MRRQDPPNARRHFMTAESMQCKIIQAQKDTLLLSLTKFFKQQITKDELKSDLGKIKTTLTANCY
jgi:hypothetical protein